MQLTELQASLQTDTPPAGLGPCVQALWFAAKGDWNQAHKIAQDQAGPDGAWVHAYLHRVEGDLGNAAYWYRCAGRPVESGSLDDEWRSMATTLLAEER